MSPGGLLEDQDRLRSLPAQVGGWVAGAQCNLAHSISEMLSRPSGRGYHAPAIRMHPICPLINLAKTDFGQVSYNAHAHPLSAASIGPP